MTDTEIKHKCPPHHWLIDNKTLIGHCKYCPAVKDFEKELAKCFAKRKTPPWCGDIRKKR